MSSFLKKRKKEKEMYSTFFFFEETTNFNEKLYLGFKPHFS
jgi:hypothetical protein